MKVLAAIGLLAIIFAVVASLYFFGGFYSVAANREDPAIVHWALMKVRTNSIVHHAQDSPRDDIAVDAVPIANQIARSIIPGERRRYLARNPFCRRMCCDIDPDQVSPRATE